MYHEDIRVRCAALRLLGSVALRPGLEGKERSSIFSLVGLVVPLLKSEDPFIREGRSQCFPLTREDYCP